MQKRGYTLTELLITLGLIGVLAALTLPNLVKNSIGKVNTGSLATTVANLESAFTKAIEQERVENLNEVSFWNTDDHTAFIGGLKRYYTEISNHSDSSGADYYSDRSSALYFTDKSGIENPKSTYKNDKDEWTIFLSDGSVIFLKFDEDDAIDEETAFERGSVIRDIIAEIIIDVNGAKAPNVVGRDAFKFYLASDGKLYPHGSIEYSRFLDGTENHYWDTENAGFSCISGYMADSWGCTARIIDEGYNINY